MQSVLNTIKKYNMFKSGEVIGVAVSGGIDSMSMLHYLKSISEDFEIEIVAINIDHCIRENSSQDSKFVEDYCKENHIRFYKFKVDSLKISSEEKLCLEEAARKGRYEIFDSLLYKGIVDKICLGHHIQDQAETILLNIFRGSGLNGAKGMDYIRDCYIRPLLNTTKEEITQYSAVNDIPFVEDDSNYDESYSRNFLRQNIMPKLRMRWKNVDKNIVEFGKICETDDQFIKSQMSFDGIIEENNLVRIPVSYFLYANPLVIRMIHKELEYLKASKDIEKKHIRIIRDMARESQNGVKINLPNNLTVHKEYDFITITVKTPKQKLKPIRFKLGNIDLINFGQITVRKTSNNEIPDEENTFVIDSNKIPEGCEIRTREVGDVFTQINGGTKKLKDYFIDKKIPQRLRADIPLICKDKEVYVILGYTVSDKVKVDDTTKIAYMITIKKNKK